VGGKKKKPPPPPPPPHPPPPPPPPPLPGGLTPEIVTTQPTVAAKNYHRAKDWGLAGHWGHPKSGGAIPRVVALTCQM